MAESNTDGPSVHTPPPEAPAAAEPEEFIPMPLDESILDNYPEESRKLLQNMKNMSVTQRIALSEKVFGNIMKREMRKKFEWEVYKRCDPVIKKLETCAASSQWHAFGCRADKKAVKECLNAEFREDKFKEYYRDQVKDRIREHYEFLAKQRQQQERIESAASSSSSSSSLSEASHTPASTS